MTAPNIGGTGFPATMKTNGGGRITPHWQEDRVAADGTLYRAGEQWLEWDWEALSTSDYNFLLTRYAALPSTFVLFTDDDRLTNATFTAGAMLKPQNGGTYRNGYVKVHVEFHALMPILT
jgi:hypothetical protein